MVGEGRGGFGGGYWYGNANVPALSPDDREGEANEVRYVQLASLTHRTSSSLVSIYGSGMSLWWSRSRCATVGNWETGR